MKRILLALITAVKLLNAPAPVQAATPIEAGVCIVIGAIVTSAGVAIVIQSCQPTWRCTSDPDNPGPTNNWCSTMTRSAAQKSGLVQVGPNFRSYRACMRICSTNQTNSLPPEPEPEPMLVVYRSYNLCDWLAVGLLEMDYDGGMSWTDPEPAEAECCFYQVREIAASPASGAWKAVSRE